jgi:hypothetical protein
LVFRAFRRGLGLVDSYRSSIVILPCRSPPPIARRSPPPKSRRCAEWDQVWYHVITCDFPETAAEWSELGREAGFGEARQVFVDPADFLRLFRFEG